MKLTVIQASPHGMKGYTGRLLKPFLAAVQEAGAAVDLFSFDSLTVYPCKGCVEICHGKGACHLEDDCDKILQSMLAAAGIVFAVPNYMFGVTAQLKALLDRLSLTLHCMRLYGKYTTTLVTCGGSPPEDVENYLHKILTQFGLRFLEGISGVMMQFDDPDENAKLEKASADLGRRLVHAITQQEKRPEEEEALSQVFAINSFIVQSQKDRWPFAFDYWNKNWEQRPSNV
jgi:multimeric flavodoxin WrbA